MFGFHLSAGGRAENAPELVNKCVAPTLNRSLCNSGFRIGSNETRARTCEQLWLQLTAVVAPEQSAVLGPPSLRGRP